VLYISGGLSNFVVLCQFPLSLKVPTSACFPRVRTAHTCLHFLRRQPTGVLAETSVLKTSILWRSRHIPHGFYEKELKGFFSQFGDVERWRVSRNKRTGRSKGYAFVKFEHPEVAKIAAEAMDGYHMFKQSLKCQVMKKRDVHPELFNKSNKVLEMKPWRKIEAEQHNKQRTPEQAQQRNLRAIKRDKRRLQQIQSAGLDFEYESLQEKLPKGPTHKKF